MVMSRFVWAASFYVWLCSSSENMFGKQIVTEIMIFDMAVEDGCWTILQNSCDVSKESLIDVDERARMSLIMVDRHF